MKRLIKVISVIIIIPFVIYFWPASLGGDTTIMLVQGQSMLPTILPGSLVVAKAAPDYQIGDIVAYEQKEGGSSKIVVHRIIDVDSRGFIIQGDNNPRKDVGYPTEDDILGTVLFSTPYVGDILGMFKNPYILVISAGIIFAIQIEQKRRKERKEKRRCILLGIPYVPPKLRNSLKKDKKPDYSMFFAAIFINILTFVLTQITIENGIKPEGDFLTHFLYNGIVPTLASTIIFAFYFVVIFGLFYLAKSYEKKSTKTSAYYSNAGNNSQRLMQRKKSNPMLAIASIGWLLYILVAIFNLMTLATTLASQIN